MFTKNLFKDYFLPTATISGSIIGVGFFSLPFIASKVGIWIMLLYFFAITLFVLTIHLIFGEISLKTPDFKRFPGFVGFYLGKWPELFAFFSMIIGSFGILLAYLIIGGSFLSKIFIPIFGGSQFSYTIFYFVLASIIIYFGIKTVSKVELSAIVLLLLSILFIFIKGFNQININNIFISNFKLEISNLFLPYGALLFSLWGIGLIPEAEEMLRGKKKLFKKIVLTATLIPAVIYLIFTILILGITGQNTTESALTGLKDVLGNGIITIILLIGVFTTFSAFVAAGLNLKKLFIYDLKIKESFAFIFTILPSMILLLLGFNSYIPLISFIGGVLLGFDGILILLMYKKIGGKKTIIFPLSAVFLFGIIYEIIYFI